jgi:hypothetical protein
MSLSRRQFLAVSGITCSLSIAGCSGPNAGDGIDYGNASVNGETTTPSAETESNSTEINEEDNSITTDSSKDEPEEQEDPESTDEPEESSTDIYTTDNGISLTSARTELTDKVFLESGSPLIPQSGNHLLLIQLSAENTTETAAQLPTPAQFDLRVESETDNPYQVTHRDNPNGVASAVSEPVSGPLFPPQTELSGNDTATGWFIFSIPLDSSTATLQLYASEEGNVVNEWEFSYEIPS